MTMIPEYEELLRELLTERADALAKATGFVKRERKVSGARFAQAVVFGRLADGAGTRRQLQHSAGQVGLEISVQGLDQRFTERAVLFMRALLEEGLRRLVTRETETAVLARFKGVYVTDCTRVEWPGEAVKVGVRLELQRGGIEACLSDMLRHDQATAVADAVLPRGALHLGDLGFFKLARFKAWSAAGVYWLSRYKVGTRLYTPHGQPIDLSDLLKGDAPRCVAVQIGSGRSASLAFLLAAPLPEPERSTRLARLLQHARHDQRSLSARQRALAHWTLYLTNLPDLSFAQAHTLARTRWQIELLFKLWKSHGALLRSRSANPIRQQVEGYAKLLALLIAHWSLLVADWNPHTLSPLDALRILRTHLVLLSLSLRGHFPFGVLFDVLRPALAAATPRHNRRQRPSTAQLWAVFDAIQS